MAENNKTQNFKSSGNIIVDQVGQMGITGNIVNPNWNYYVTNESGKTNYLAVQILAEIVYWYRPSIKENKEKNNTETTAVTESAPARNVHTPTPDSYTVDCGCDRLFELTKELFIKYNLNDKDISDIINVAQSDFNKITKAHKVIVNYKKPIISVMGFLRNAIINNWNPDDKESHANNSLNEYLKRNGLKSEEELYSILFVS